MFVYLLPRNELPRNVAAQKAHACVAPRFCGERSGRCLSGSPRTASGVSPRPRPHLETPRQRRGLGHVSRPRCAGTGQERGAGCLVSSPAACGRLVPHQVVGASETGRETCSALEPRPPCPVPAPCPRRPATPALPVAVRQARRTQLHLQGQPRSPHSADTRGTTASVTGPVRPPQARGPQELGAGPARPSQGSRHSAGREARVPAHSGEGAAAATPPPAPRGKRTGSARSIPGRAGVTGRGAEQPLRSCRRPHDGRDGQLATS